MALVTITELYVSLLEEAEGIATTALQSHREAPNSYGAGYDAGYLAAWRRVIKLALGKGEE